MNKVTVKKESKVTITINGKNYVYTEEEARSLYEGLCELFQTDKQPPKSNLDELRDCFDKMKKSKNGQYEKHHGIPLPSWHEIPWKQPDVWCEVPIDQQMFYR
jgi:hypothetical protein